MEYRQISWYDFKKSKRLYNTVKQWSPKALRMKNKDFDSFNNDRINALRKRIDELIFLKNSWEKQGKSTKTND